MNCINEIEEYILNEIELTYGKNIKQYIENLTIEDKHVAMFGAISLKKDGEHKQMIETLRKDTSVILNQIEKIIERFRKYLPVGDVEKKSFGEVFTPFSLVNEMLDTLPVDVWSNPNLKWGDFCNGIGNFMIVVVKRLMIGLESWEPNENKRYKHIMENMIYVAELQIKNMFLWMVSMDPKSKLKLNLYRGDSLSSEFDKHIKEVWNVDKFDVLVSNVPYQEQKEGNKQSSSIWDKFVIKYIEKLLSIDGYLVCVHPDGWRSMSKGFLKVKELLKNKQMLYLEVHDTADGIKTFGAGTTYDFYCVKNHMNDNNHITKVKCLDGKIENVNISNMNFIPNGMFDMFNKLVAKDGEEKINFLYSRIAYGHDKQHMSKQKIGNFIYPCVYLTYKDESIKFLYSNTNKNGHFGVPKIIWSNGAASMPIIDINGDYGVVDFSYAIVDNVENLQNIKNAMNNNKFIKLMSFSNSATHKYNQNIIATFRKDFWKEFVDI